MERRNTAALLYRAYLRLAGEINDTVLSRTPEVRAAHATVFLNMELDGIRLTRLAEKAQMTPQAMGELVDELERLGYLRRTPDPTDRRAKLIIFSSRGREALETAFDVIDGVERELARSLGRAKLTELQNTLEKIIGE